MQHTDSFQNLRSSLFRLSLRTAVYALILGIISIGMLWGAVTYDDAFFDETGPVETLQTIFTMSAALIFLLAGRRHPQSQPCAVTVAALLFCFFIRESDYFLDVLAGRHTWKVLVTLVLALLGCYVLRSHRQVIVSVTNFAQRAGFGIFISGVLVLIVFSRLFGYGPFWYAILDDNSYRTVKTIVEEGVELMGYFLILISSVEYFHDLRAGDSPPEGLPSP
jgi:hypothetical protein